MSKNEKPGKFINRSRRKRIYLILLSLTTIPIISGRETKSGVAWVDFKYLAEKCRGGKDCHVELAKAFPVCFYENVVWVRTEWSQGIKNVDCVERKTGFKFKENDTP